MHFTRYALYFTPPPGRLAKFGVSWLGWDPVGGHAVSGPRDLSFDWDTATATPRKYGLHATLKPPFRLRVGTRIEELDCMVQALSGTLRPVSLDGLELTELGRFLALIPEYDTEALTGLAATLVRDLDGFRAPLTEDELGKRRACGLNARQEALLQKWGYPHVMEAFHFHITLTGRLPKPERFAIKAHLSAILPAVLPRPFLVDAITLMGEAENGMFHQIKRYPLTG